jgi:hypothetical protein
MDTSMPKYGLMLDELLQKGQEFISTADNGNSFETNRIINDQGLVHPIADENLFGVKLSNVTSHAASAKLETVEMNPTLKLIEDMRIANEKKYASLMSSISDPVDKVQTVAGDAHNVKVAKSATSLSSLPHPTVVAGPVTPRSNPGLAGYAMTSRDLLQDLAHRRLEDTSTYKQANGSCPYQYKVYVYPLDPSLSVVRLAEEARTNRSLHVCRKCILEQFALEYVFHDFFTQFCGRTEDPEEADFFYLPIVRDAEYRWNMHLKMKGAKSPSRAEEAIISLIEKDDPKPWQSYFGTTMEYWNRRKGADHIFIMPAPVTNFRHESNARGFFHFMMHLHTPIFVGLEYSIQFVTEYPVCATTKNIVVPYPIVDPDLYAGRYQKRYEEKMKLSKTALLFYSGGLHGECTPVRKAMREIMHNGTLLPGNVVPALKKKDLVDREIGFYSSVFCPIPVGDSPSSKRMYDVLNFNCIPVVISDDIVWAFSVQTGGKIDPTTYSIQIPQCIVHWPLVRVLQRYDRNSLPTRLPSGRYIYDILLDIHAANLAGEVGGGPNRNMYHKGVYINPLIQLLQRVSAKDIASLQLGGRNAVKYFLYYPIDPTPRADDNIIPLALRTLPTGGAIDMFSYQLQRIKDTNTTVIRDLCLAEKARPHPYIGHFRCDKDILHPPRLRGQFPLGTR